MHRLEVLVPGKGKAAIRVDGKELKYTTKLVMRAEVGEYPIVELGLLVLPEHVDVRGYIIPLAHLPDIEEEVARQLYERLEARFGGGDNGGRQRDYSQGDAPASGREARPDRARRAKLGG